MRTQPFFYLCVPQKSPPLWALDITLTDIGQHCDTPNSGQGKNNGAFLHRPKKLCGIEKPSTPRKLWSPKFRLAFIAYSSRVLFVGSIDTEVRAGGQDDHQAEGRRHPGQGISGDAHLQTATLCVQDPETLYPMSPFTSSSSWLQR